MNLEHATWNSGIDYAALSDVGLRRANNQDSWIAVVAPTPEKFERRGHLFIVADGMGAHAAGELASKLAVDLVSLTYDKLLDLPAVEALHEAVIEANRQIHNRGQSSDDFRGMGTTIDALLIVPQGAVVAHVGDSRVYRWRNHRIEQLTFDHSLVWEMRAAGAIGRDGVPPYVPRNIITRSMGPNPQLRVDVEGPYPIERGDVYLLCSDGLSGPIEDAELGQIIGAMSPQEAVRSLIDLANLRGGPDNITAIVIRVGNGSGEAAAAAPALHPPLAMKSLKSWKAIAVATAVLLAAITGHWLLAALLAAAAAAIYFAGQLLPTDRPLGVVPPHERTGAGPYAERDCPPDNAFAQQLAAMVKQLRDAAISDAWTVDWAPFDRWENDANQAVATGHFAQAIADYCRAIGNMMEQLKQQRAKRGDE